MFFTFFFILKMYTHVESFLANFSFVILFISMIIYWAQASNFKLETELNSVKTENTFPQIIKNLFNFKTLGTTLTAIANISLLSLLVLRWKESGHFPLSNLYESLMFLSWCLTVIHLTIELGLASKTNQNSKKGVGVVASKLIGSITAPSALFTNAFATFSLPKEMQGASPLVPALQSNWLMMHVCDLLVLTL